ncbi:phosphotransferase [Primorskyibacter aestuariivivens]|uniref:phosphotransferase n=1 Tax=Primorskyibacter aestuariivivens TaxID=1888912 RepID=UPI002301770E|nr:phosphotransferase [Primorskyibacter aestuariivivens]MDA7428453.1 phosphotransferase [Primorskyibacter aestuariivivens]
MLVEDFPLEAWYALNPDEPPADIELFGPAIWRVGDRVFKRFPDAPLSRFRRIVRAHRQAGRLLRDVPGLDAQKLLRFDEDHRALLLSLVSGRSGRMELLAGAAPEEVLSRAADWLRVLHAGRETSTATFDAKAPLERLDPAPDCVDEVMYKRAVVALQEEAARLQGRAVTRAVLHGDMTLANLLFSPGAVTGIDFENLAQHAVARDVGELWADTLLHVPAMPKVWGLVPLAWEEAFVTRYGNCDVEVCAFFARHRMLLAWAGIPAADMKRGPSGDRKRARLHKFIGNGGFGVGILD